MNVIVDVRGMNVNMRVGDGSNRGNFLRLAPKALYSMLALGQRAQESDYP